MSSTHLKGCLVCSLYIYIRVRFPCLFSITLEQLLSSSQMKHPVMTTPLFSLTFHAIFLLFHSISILNFSLATTLSNETNKLALLEFKSHIDKPLSVLASWNESFHFYQWVGGHLWQQTPKSHLFGLAKQKYGRHHITPHWKSFFPSIPWLFK